MKAVTSRLSPESNCECPIFAISCKTSAYGTQISKMGRAH